jgi:hypothetical protein
MSLPLLGLRVRLKEGTTAAFTCEYEASFTDGTRIGPVADGVPCEAASLAPLEAFRLEIRPSAAESKRHSMPPGKGRPRHPSR